MKVDPNLEEGLTEDDCLEADLDTLEEERQELDESFPDLSGVAVQCPCDMEDDPFAGGGTDLTPEELSAIGREKLGLWG